MKSRNKRRYVETFDDGPGGWIGFANNTDGPKRLEIRNGAAISHSPWWIDYNHAPPGGGYLHVLFCLLTKGPGFGEAYNEIAGPNRFVRGGFPRDFTNARVTARLKGEVKLRGARFVIHVQSQGDERRVNFVLNKRPFRITPTWTTQTVTLSPDPKLWTCLGSRHDRTDYYGAGKIEDVLRDLNVDIIFVLHPLNIAPLGPIDGNPHRLRAGRDYPVWLSRLPEGYVMLDEVRIEFP
jgi:hypothetical protein